MYGKVSDHPSVGIDWTAGGFDCDDFDGRCVGSNATLGFGSDGMLLAVTYALSEVPCTGDTSSINRQPL